MFVGNMGNKIHESRHGGDISRGSLTNTTYGVQDEVSAYKAQYSFDGKLDYIPYTNFDNLANLLQLASGGLQSFKTTITNINQITPGVVNGMVDKPGLMQISIYPPPGVPVSQWNNN
jgi:hypothetical protein